MRIALAGISGYGDKYLSMLENYVPNGLKQLVGVIDPKGDQSYHLPWIRKSGIKIYDTVTEFYNHEHADLMILSSPVSFHYEQTLESIRHNSYVLCEKPLVPTLQEAIDLDRETGKQSERIGVGFQWSYAQCMQVLKKRIQAGDFGAPKYLKAMVSWPREWTYYSRSAWHGRIRDEHGRLVMDSIVSNAAAHYLHNMLFVMGKEPEKAAMPESIEGSIYRGKKIESYDTCFLRGMLEDKIPFLFVASHASHVTSNPQFEYRFEKAVIGYREDRDPFLHVYWTDGRKEILGKPQSVAEEAEKINWMIRCVENNERPACQLKTVLPHLLVTNVLMERMPIIPFDNTMKTQGPNLPDEWVCGLFEAMSACYEQFVLPDEINIPWASQSCYIALEKTKEYQQIVKLIELI